MYYMASTAHASKQFHQLQMFATPHELGQMWSGDYTGLKVENTYASTRRGDAAYLDRLTSKVASDGGFTNPVMVAHGKGEPLLVNGHHRATVAAETDRLVPVRHYDDARVAYDETYSSEEQPYYHELRA